MTALHLEHHVSRPILLLKESLSKALSLTMAVY